MKCILYVVLVLLGSSSTSRSLLCFVPGRSQGSHSKQKRDLPFLSYQIIPISLPISLPYYQHVLSNLAILLPIIRLEFHVSHPPFGAAQERSAARCVRRIGPSEAQDLALERSSLSMCIQIRVIYQLINICFFLCIYIIPSGELT